MSESSSLKHTLSNNMTNIHFFFHISAVIGRMITYEDLGTPLLWIFSSALGLTGGNEAD